MHVIGGETADVITSLISDIHLLRSVSRRCKPREDIMCDYQPPDETVRDRHLEGGEADENETSCAVVHGRSSSAWADMSIIFRSGDGVTAPGQDANVRMLIGQPNVGFASALTAAEFAAASSARRHSSWLVIPTGKHISL